MESREVRGVPAVVAEFLAFSVAVFKGVFKGSLLVVASFFSAGSAELPDIRRAAADVGGLFSTIFDAAAGVKEARFTVPATRGLFTSALGLPGPFLTSSTELVDRRDR